MRGVFPRLALSAFKSVRKSVSTEPDGGGGVVVGLGVGEVVGFGVGVGV